LHEAWDRYQLPLAVTEAHIDANREDQLRWLLEIWQAAQQARRDGVDVRAVTAWSLLGAFDWNNWSPSERAITKPAPTTCAAPNHGRPRWPD
jgi:dTDP-4-dehydrorhamnose reductase